MQTNNDIISFDKELAYKIARDYSISTGMECLVVNIDDSELLNPCEGMIHQELCYQQEASIYQCCKDTHLLSSLEAAKNKKPYIYFCPMGLLHWATPIMVNGKLAGGLIGGHAFLEKAKDDLHNLKSVLPQYPKLLIEHPQLKNVLLESPVISNEKLQSLSNILYELAKRLDVKDTTENKIVKNSENLKNFSNMVNGIKNKESYVDIAIEYKALERLLASRNSDGAKTELLQNISLIFSNSDINVIKNNLTNLIIIIFRNTMKNREDNQVVFQLGFDAINIMEEIDNTIRLKSWADHTLPELLSCCMQYPEIKHVDMIYKSIEYIKKNYPGKISLEDISNMVHFSPPYFSKVFKKEMGVTFTQYLKEIRIHESMKLLKNPNIPLVEIPNQVGFEEQSYFSKVFKEITGISPGKFRDMNEDSYSAIS